MNHKDFIKWAKENAPDGMIYRESKLSSILDSKILTLVYVNKDNAIESDKKES